MRNLLSWFFLMASAVTLYLAGWFFGRRDLRTRPPNPAPTGTPVIDMTQPTAFCFGCEKKALLVTWHEDRKSGICRPCRSFLQAPDRAARHDV
jgi:hypothetical protein